MPTRIMCLPHAGAGASVYRPWRDHGSGAVRITPVQLPGREELFVEDFYPTMTRAAEGTAARVLAAAGGEPFALFGHSFGAVLAYETAHVLVARGAPPRHLVVSGALAPPRVVGRMPVSGLDDDQLAAGVRDMIGYDHEALRDPDLRELLLPVLRADMVLLEDYRPTTRPLPTPITALRGADDVMVSAAASREWADHTSERFALLELPGGHMYFTEAFPLLWKTVEDLL
ncbi:thioesterase II family protein [Saccharothrix obliqua]|uniref:thioesterase II family protein n=1 Tax=Saccharothrix obliqua TaxID=2861747 RepID=UPI001C5E5839|nr:alpha/beta fold hydrolase [Saccharothrix obliqua]MBW4718325.1 alpha/beta fold hydrolase [Saccharothrix obliqua]